MGLLSISRVVLRSLQLVIYTSICKRYNLDKSGLVAYVHLGSNQVVSWHKLPRYLYSCIIRYVFHVWSWDQLVVITHNLFVKWLPSERRPERSSMRRHKSSTTINSSGDDERHHQESFQRRWSFRLPHSSTNPSLSSSSSSTTSWTALKIPDYFKESSKTEDEKDLVKESESPVLSLKRFVSHSDLTRVSNKPRYGSLSTFLSTPSSSTSSIPAKVNLILISRISWQGQVNSQCLVLHPDLPFISKL